MPIPGTGSLHLPAGEVTVSLHTRVISSPSGGGLPVPQLSMTITSPDGVADPAVDESIGSTTTVNNDARRRVWRMQVAAEGDYRITTAGQVGGFISPRLAFGHANSYGYLIWAFAALFGLGVLGLVGTRWWPWRAHRQRATPADVEPAVTVVPSDEGIRIEQLKTLTALRDSGALTEAEFEAEKRRVLRSDY